MTKDPIASAPDYELEKSFRFLGTDRQLIAVAERCVGDLPGKRFGLKPAFFRSLIGYGELDVLDTAANITKILDDATPKYRVVWILAGKVKYLTDNPAVGLQRITYSSIAQRLPDPLPKTVTITEKSVRPSGLVVKITDCDSNANQVTGVIQARTFLGFALEALLAAIARWNNAKSATPTDSDPQTTYSSGDNGNVNGRSTDVPAIPPASPPAEVRLAKLTGRQVKTLCDLLEASFTEFELRRLVRIHLDETLDSIAPGTAVRDRVFNLVDWAERRQRLRELLMAAKEENPGKVDLVNFCDSLLA